MAGLFVARARVVVLAALCLFSSVTLAAAQTPAAPQPAPAKIGRAHV